MFEIFSTYFQFLKGQKSICYYLRANVREKVNISVDDALISIQSKCNLQQQVSIGVPCYQLPPRIFIMELSSTIFHVESGQPTLLKSLNLIARRRNIFLLS